MIFIEKFTIPWYRREHTIDVEVCADLGRVGFVCGVDEFLVYVQIRFGAYYFDIDQIGYEANETMHNEEVAGLEVLFEACSQCVNGLSK